jgi:cell division septation protein DedD
MKRLMLFFILSMLITQSYAQASGGQIRRKVNTTSKTNHVKRNRTSEVKSNNSVEALSTVPIIQPTPISGFSTYNVVVGSMGILANASRFCQTLRDKGYTSLIYQDNRPGTVLYRITIGSSNNEQEALRIRDQARNTYPDAWILYFVNGKQERYW